MGTEKALDSRLMSALPYVRRGGTVADIGTDHAYLPIELIRRGISERAVACDVNKGPILRARAHISEAGLTDRIDTVQTDGLHGVERFRPDDILIFGMGGELIVKILSEAPWVRDGAVGLILQPMTKASTLRRWLSESGFSILGESLTYEDQYYQTIYARFGGEAEVYRAEELLLGRHILNGDSKYLEGFIRRNLQILSAAAEGKRKGYADTSEEDALIGALEARLQRLREKSSAQLTGTQTESRSGKETTV